MAGAQEFVSQNRKMTMHVEARAAEQKELGKNQEGVRARTTSAPRLAPSAFAALPLFTAIST
jgi:hypothetical protein